jgi:hypothetical protein
MLPAALAALMVLAPAAAPATAACGPGETAVVVDTAAHRMHLCAAGRLEETFAVALGTGGVGKQREGDERTPLGRYGLGPPRASRSFHVFVPVAYPTPAQARQGFTGGAIGIHGPPRVPGGIAAPRLLVRTDWTDGCIAVSSDEEIERIAAWVRGREVRGVRLVP